MSGSIGKTSSYSITYGLFDPVRKQLVHRLVLEVVSSSITKKLLNCHELVVRGGCFAVVVLEAGVKSVRVLFDETLTIPHIP